MKVYKYPLPHSLNVLDVPIGWRALCLAEQHGERQLWLEVDPSAPRERVEIHKLGTGSDIPNCSMHIGTILSNGGHFVWHYYARAAAELSSN